MALRNAYNVLKDPTMRDMYDSSGLGWSSGDPSSASASSFQGFSAYSWRDEAMMAEIRRRRNGGQFHGGRRYGYGGGGGGRGGAEYSQARWGGGGTEWDGFDGPNGPAGEPANPNGNYISNTNFLLSIMVVVSRACGWCVVFGQFSFC